MKCKQCKKEVKRVRVYSEAWQWADVDEKGKVTDYGRVEELTDDTLAVECEHCGYDFYKKDEIEL